MPLLKNIPLPSGQIALWKTEESEALPHLARLTPKEIQKAESLSTRRKTEFLMVRELLPALGLSNEIIYSKSGKPHLKNDSRHISISHAYPFAAVGISAKPLGLDLEHLHEKIRKVQERFLHFTEKEWLGEEPELQSLAALWSAKESLYKLDERHLYSFRNHYFLHPFLFEPGGSFRAEVFDEQNAQNYEGKMWQIENCLLTAAWESKG